MKRNIINFFLIILLISITINISFAAEVPTADSETAILMHPSRTNSIWKRI